MSNLIRIGHLQVEVLDDEAVGALVRAEGGSLPDGRRLCPMVRFRQGLAANIEAAKSNNFELKSENLQ